MKIRNIRTKLLSLGLAVTMLAGLTACGSSSAATTSSTDAATEAASTASAGEKTVTYATSLSWDGFNFYATTNTNTDEVIEFLYDKLFDLNADGTVSPRLANDYEVNDTYDVYTFHLNENSTWHDGEPVTAEDVVYTFQVATTADQDWLYRIKLIDGTDDDGIETSEDSVAVKAVDDYTVEFTLKQPTDELTFLTELKGWFIVPQHILGQYADAELDTIDYWDAPIASGPMKFDSQIEGERFELVKFDDYYLGAVDFDRLIIRLMDASAITAGIMSGEVDFTKSLVALDVAALEASDSYVVESIPSFSHQNVVLNLSDPVFEDVRVRQAIAKAVNRQAIVDNIYLGYGQVINSLYPETHPYYNDAVTDQYDPEGAKALLEEAGWDENTVIEFQVPTGNEARVQSSLLIQQDLEAVGIKTSIVSYDFATVLQNMRDEKFQILLMGAEGSASPSSYTGSLTYFSHTTDEEILADIDDGAAALSTEDKKTYYDDLQLQLIDKAPILFIYSPNSLIVHSTRITADFSKVNVNVNKRIWEWTVTD